LTQFPSAIVLDIWRFKVRATFKKKDMRVVRGGEVEVLDLRIRIEGAIGREDADLGFQAICAGEATDRTLGVAVDAVGGSVQIWTKWKGVILQSFAVLR
jgi:hypothetical protein